MPKKEPETLTPHANSAIPRKHCLRQEHGGSEIIGLHSAVEHFLRFSCGSELQFGSRCFRMDFPTKSSDPQALNPKNYKLERRVEHKA